MILFMIETHYENRQHTYGMLFTAGIEDMLIEQSLIKLMKFIEKLTETSTFQLKTTL